MVRDIQRYNEAEKLRRDGRSYREISKILSISKSTLNDWFSNQDWSETLKKELIAKNKYSWRKSLRLAKIAIIKKRLARQSKFIEEARLQFQILKRDPLFLVGLTAYWGEGNKASRSCVSFVNTDPELVKVISNFYGKCLKIPTEKLRIGLFIYDDINEREMKEFWSNKLNISKNQFIKTQILPSRSHLTHRKSKYGICSLYFSNTELSIKIREWIRLLGLEYAGIA